MNETKEKGRGRKEGRKGKRKKEIRGNKEGTEEARKTLLW